MNEDVKHEGPNVVEPNGEEAGGRGLFEFRLDQDIEQILARKAKRARMKDTAGDAGRILLRVFFHTHGDTIIFLAATTRRSTRATPTSSVRSSSREGDSHRGS